MKLILLVVFVVRFFLSLLTYNGDVNNHLAWMESVEQSGWHGLYERDLSPWAAVNYPPLTLYSFWLGEKLYQLAPSWMQTSAFHASMYKLPSLLADCLVAYLIWRYTRFTKKTKVLIMSAYLLNPVLFYNSVFWGQVESLVTFFCLLSLLLLARGRSAYGILAFALAMLTKQNALPLIPVIFSALYLTKPTVKQLFGSLLVILCLTYFAYLPLAPLGNNVLSYAYHSYASSIGGQPHQHQATVNALNYWYAIGANELNDAFQVVGRVPARLLGLSLTGLGVMMSLWLIARYKRDHYHSLFLAASLISLFAFTFATRMHERHNYMMIAYLTFLLPYMKWRWPYYLLSGIGFYNLYAVWSESFATLGGVTNWELWTRSLATLTTLLVIAYPLWLLNFSKSKE